MAGENGDRVAAWNALCLTSGSPFHSADFCALAQRCWPGAERPRHVATFRDGRCRGVIPAYRYGDCPRLGYYRRNVEPALEDSVIGAHALVGWYGGPVAEDDVALREVLQDHLDLCRDEGSVSLLFGIDGRDVGTLRELAAFGYHVGRLQTNAVLKILPAHASDPLAAIRRKDERSERRRVRRRAEESGLKLRIVRPSDAVAHVELIRSAVNRLAIDDDILPSPFVRAALRAELPGLEVLLAVAPGDKVAAINLNFVWGRAYYLWLAGNDRALAKPFYPSDFLYQHSIRRAAQLGLAEIQAGRSPYAIKMAYGFECTPIMCALHPLAVGDPGVAAGWLAAQEARHLASYPEVSAESA